MTHIYDRTKNLKIKLKIYGLRLLKVFHHKFNRYKRIFTKVDASIFDSALSHTRRSDTSEK